MSADTIWPVLVQSFVDAVTCAFIAALGALVSARVVLIAGDLAALWPNMIVHSQLILEDSLFLFFAAAGLYVSAQCLLKPRIAYAAAAGIVFGLMTLVRPVGLLIPFAMNAIFLFGRFVARPWIQESDRIFRRGPCDLCGHDLADTLAERDKFWHLAIDESVRDAFSDVGRELLKIHRDGNHIRSGFQTAAG